MYVELPLTIFKFLMILSHAVDEVEDFEPVQKKPRLDSDTDHDGMWSVCQPAIN